MSYEDRVVLVTGVVFIILSMFGLWKIGEIIIYFVN